MFPLIDFVLYGFVHDLYGLVLVELLLLEGCWGFLVSVDWVGLDVFVGCFGVCNGRGASYGFLSGSLCLE